MTLALSQRACNVCHQEFPRTAEFWHKQPKNSDGLSETCKQCAIERQRDWYFANHERALAQHREYREQNHEQVLAGKHRYRAANLDKVLAADRTWKAANVEKRVAYTARWRRANPEKAAALRKREYEANAHLIKQRAKDWWTANRERARARAAEYRKKNAERIKERKREEYVRNIEKVKARCKVWAESNPAKLQARRARYQALLVNAPGHFTPADLVEQYQKQDGLCFYCHTKLRKLGSVDHYIPLSKGGTNYADNIVLACWPCNNRKRAKLPSEFRSKSAK